MALYHRAGKTPSATALPTAVIPTPIRRAPLRLPISWQMERGVSDVSMSCMNPNLVQKNWTGKIQSAWRSNKMDGPYDRSMDFDEKVRLARKDDTGLEACAIRLRAARIFTGRQSKDLAKDCGVSKTVFSNAEGGSTYPNRDVMKHLFRAYRIDFNFMMNGDFVQLPGDVQEQLFPALEAAEIEWDRRERSDRPQASGQPSQA